MTEAEWLACDQPAPMLAALGTAATERKLRLFVVACARRVLPEHADDEMVAALEVAERFADGAASKSALDRARRALAAHQQERVARWFPLYVHHVRSVPAWHAARPVMARTAADGADCCAWSSTREALPGLGTAMTYPEDEYAAQVALVRDLFGNPFRPVAFDPSWRTDTARSLARQAYDARDFTLLPTLADALADAGCGDDQLLGHCGGGGEHRRGCWAIDLVMEKE